MAMIGLVWLDGAPAIGMEYGPGDNPACCPICSTCLSLIVEAQRGDTTLGWLLFDDDAKCGHILDAAQYSMNVTGKPGAVTVDFSAKETGDNDHASLGSDRAGASRSGSDLPAGDSGKQRTSTPRKRSSSRTAKGARSRGAEGAVGADLEHGRGPSVD